MANALPWRQFASLVFKGWRRGVTGPTTAVLFTGGLLVGMAGLLGMPLPKSSLSVPAAWAVAILCGIKTGYNIWFGEYESKQRLQKMLDGRISILHIFHYDEETNRGGPSASIDLEIRNDSGKEFANCLVCVVAIEARDGTNPITRHLPMALRTIRNVEREGGGPFHLRAGQTKRVPVCAKAMDLSSGIFIAYEQADDFTQLQLANSLRETRDLSLKIEIYGAPMPTIATIHLIVDDEGKLLGKIVS